MLDRMVAKARGQEVFSREDTPTERRVLAAFLYHVGLSYRRIEPVVDRSHDAIRQWFHRLKHLFAPDCQEREEVDVWAAVDCETLDALDVDVSPGRSSLDALLFLNEVLKHCRGRPAPAGDRGPWYDWPVDFLDCDSERATWGNRSLVEAWFGNIIIPAEAEDTSIRAIEILFNVCRVESPSSRSNAATSGSE